jgi:hypothetical protein
MLTDLGMHQGLTERNLYLHEAIERRRDRASGGNARLAPTPRRRSSMSPARPTTSITSTSSTSFFPSIGAVNPTLIIIANALRVGQHLIERLM